MVKCIGSAMLKKSKILLLLIIGFVQAQAGLTFSNIAGLPEVKQQLFDVVNFLKNPAVYKNFGANVSHGVLITGPAGSGKTLVAKAIAGEANCVIYQINRTTFVGLTTDRFIAKCDDIFKQAISTSPCVILIEELDVLLNNFGNNKFDAITKLIVLFDQIRNCRDSLVVVATANNLEQIDKTLLGRGRFDCQVKMPILDLQGREELIKLQLQKVKIDPTLDIHRFAVMASGDLTSRIIEIVDVAVNNAIKNGSEVVGTKDFEEAFLEKRSGGEIKKWDTSPVCLIKTAYHEAGHALVAVLLDMPYSLEKVTIVSRCSYLGMTFLKHDGLDDPKSNKFMMDYIAMCLGGRAAEELVFGVLCSGAYSDLVKASKQARDMICYYGMRPELVGMAVYSQKNGDYTYSQALAEKIDLSVIKILDECYERAKSLLTTNRDKLDKLANALLEKETMYASEIYELLGIEARSDLRLTKL